MWEKSLRYPSGFHGSWREAQFGSLSVCNSLTDAGKGGVSKVAPVVRSGPYMREKSPMASSTIMVSLLACRTRTSMVALVRPAASSTM